MAIIVDKIKTAYFPSPKVACTSIKRIFYRIENGTDFINSVRNGSMFHIHSYYGSPPFSKVPKENLKGYEKVCVVRDPIKRFLSCYSNRVCYHRELSENFLSSEAISAGAIPNPTLNIFAERLEIYRNYSVSIRHHTDPQVYFIGNSKNFYSRIYQMDELEELASDLSIKAGVILKLPHAQNGGIKISLDDLTTNMAHKLHTFYKEDYDSYAFS